MKGEADATRREVAPEPIRYRAYRLYFSLLPFQLAFVTPTITKWLKSNLIFLPRPWAPAGSFAFLLGPWRSPLLTLAFPRATDFSAAFLGCFFGEGDGVTCSTSTDRSSLSGVELLDELVDDKASLHPQTYYRRCFRCCCYCRPRYCCCCCLE